MKVLSKTRTLPVLTVCGTDFEVDAVYNELRQTDIAYNTISFKEIGISDYETTEFAYDLQTKNVYAGIIDPDNIPEKVKLVIVPPLSQLDPLALQRRQHQAQNPIQEERHTHIVKRRKGLHQ